MTTPAQESATRTRMADFDYDLPAELIAQVPLLDRSASRLLVLDRSRQRLIHARFQDLPDFLRPGDLLVLNDSRVIPARLRIRRQTGGAGELLLLQRTSEEHDWLVLARPFRRLNVGEVVEVVPATSDMQAEAATIVEKRQDATAVVRLSPSLEKALDHYGRVPLPPYITTELDDPERYQTVYGTVPGSAAAPTAGLHFTPDVLDGLKQRGVDVAYVTLHVGLDTFRPVVEDLAEEHQIHSEWCSVPTSTVEAITRCRERAGRVVAGGTTSARTLEALGTAAAGDALRAFTGPTDIFITPGYRWTLVDAMITNFHLPRSTLLLMVSAFATREFILRGYREAIEQRYRFFSFGDATLIL